MKKILLIIVSLSLMAFTSQAQSGNLLTTMTNPNGAAIDTVTNATAEGATLKVPGSYNSLSVTINLTKISGTVAGKVYLKVSNDGVGYGDNAIDSATLKDASATYQLSSSPKRFLYYKVEIAGTGTLSASYTKPTLYAIKKE